MSRTWVGVVAAVTVLVAGCGGGGGGDTYVPPDTRNLDVQAGAFLAAGHLEVIADVYLDGMAVSNATVTVNGVAIPWSPADGRYHSYSGTTLGPGSGLTFSATVETLQATAYEIIPPDVVIASPAPGITYTASSLILVCWDPVSPAPDYYGVDVPASHTQSGNAYSISLPGTETDTDLPPGTMLAGYTNLQVSVTARNQSQMAGRAMIGDYFNVGNMSVALFATQ